MRKVYEIKRHRMVDMWIGYNLGMMEKSEETINQLIDAENEEIAKIVLFREKTELFTDREMVEINELIATGEGRIRGLKDTKQQNVNVVYDRVREMIDSKNIIGVDITKEYIEVIEFDMESNRDVVIMGREDDNGRFYIEVE